MKAGASVTAGMALAEARLLTLSTMISSRLGRHEEARTTLLDVVARGDARAVALLDAPYADVQAEVSKLTGTDGRERLIQDRPVFRDIVAAHGRRGGPPAAH